MSWSPHHQPRHRGGPCPGPGEQGPQRLLPLAVAGALEYGRPRPGAVSTVASASSQPDRGRRGRHLVSSHRATTVRGRDASRFRHVDVRRQEGETSLIRLWAQLGGSLGLGGLPVESQARVAVPVLFRLYRSKRRCPKSLHRKRTELAAELLGVLRTWLPEGRALDLAGDGEYACKTLLRDLPDEVVFTGPMVMDAALFEKPGKQARRGRRRLKGRRLASPRKRAGRCQWTKTKVQMYGREVDILIHSFVCLWYTVTKTRQVRVVLTRDPRGRWKDRAYFCTDSSRSPEEILSRYATRWYLEVTFQNVKQSLGLEDPRNGWWRRVRGRRADTTRAGPSRVGIAGAKRWNARFHSSSLHTGLLCFGSSSTETGNESWRGTEDSSRGMDKSSSRPSPTCLPLYAESSGANAFLSTRRYDRIARKSSGFWRARLAQRKGPQPMGSLGRATPCLIGSTLGPEGQSRG